MQFLIGFNSVQLTPRTGVRSPPTSKASENDGCNDRAATTVQPSAVHCPPGANFTLSDAARSVRRTGGRIRNDAPSRYGRFYVNGVTRSRRRAFAP
jgi:hypothetical protein